jgi:hypothetical protein
MFTACLFCSTVAKNGVGAPQIQGGGELGAHLVRFEKRRGGRYQADVIIGQAPRKADDRKGHRALFAYVLNTLSRANYRNTGHGHRLPVPTLGKSFFSIAPQP